MNLTETDRKELELHKALIELGGRLIRNTISLEEMAWLVLTPVMRLTGTTVGFVSYIDPETKENVGFLNAPGIAACVEQNQGRMVFRFPTGKDDPLWGFSQPDTRTGFFTNKPVKHQISKNIPSVVRFPIDNFLSVPVVAGSNLLGHVALANKKGGFSNEDIRIVNLLGELYGLALDRKFYEQALLDAEHKATEKLNHRFRAFMEATPDRLHIISSDGVFLESHRGALPFVESDPSKYIGKTLHDLFPADADKMLDKVREALAMDGTPIIWEYTISQLPDHVFEGHLIKCGPDEVMTVIREVTQAKQLQSDLERKVEERTLELSLSNQALQSFAYAASHDLREPLNKIRAYGERFERTHPNLDEKGKEYIGVMVTAAERLAQLVEDLLVYSKAGGKDEASPVKIPLNRLIEETLGDLDESVKNSGAIVEVGDLPTVEGHAGTLRAVFQNVLSNALKFHKVGQPPKVLVSGRVDGSMAFVSIQDNGIGFDPAYKEKIFAIFNRLHTRFEYPGTGIGLALCRRLLAQCGGTVTADARPNEGAVFTIQIPLKFSSAFPKGT
jgi:signal transduction histidine kinase